MIFKEEMQTSLIPRVKLMIEKEENHIKWLEERKSKFQKFILKFEYSNTVVKNLEEMIQISKNTLVHLKNRYQEYIDYTEKL